MDLRRVLVFTCVLVAACIAAIVVAHPEHIPQNLTPPPHSNVVMAKGADPETTESPEADPADEPQKGYALSRQDLEQNLLKVRSRAVACKDESTPPAVQVKIVIAPNGAVTSVSVPDELRHTAAGECISRAFHSATFPAWSAPQVPQIEWTYTLHFDLE